MNPGNAPTKVPLTVREDGYNNTSEQLYSAQETALGIGEGLSQYCHEQGGPQGELPFGG